MISGLPKIALARLKAKAGTAAASGGSSGPGDFQGAEHPDANLLAALAETRLTDEERMQVLNHLSQCADCREVAALMLPPHAAETETAVAAASRYWNPWLALRWGALAAVLGTISVIVLLHPTTWRRPLEISKATTPPAPAESVTVIPHPVPSPPSSLQSTESAPDKAQTSVRRDAALGKASALERDQNLQEREARAIANQQTAMMASNRGDRYQAASGGGVSTEQKHRGPNMPRAAAPSATAFPGEPAGVPMAAADEAGKVSTQSQSAAETLHTATTNGIIGAAAPPAAPAAKGASRTSSEGDSHSTFQSGLGGMVAARRKIDINSGQTAALWRLSADGKVQRSGDEGKSFKHVHVAHGIKFRAITSLGNEVWTGGTGGVLFHSADGGATWTGTPINWEGNTVTETIVGIQSRDPQHLTVTTDSGAQWVSEDGGRHWRKTL